MLLLDVSLMNFIFWISNDNQMEGESGVTRSTIDELYSSDNQENQMEGEKGVTQSIIEELHSSYIQGDQMEDESGVT